LDKQKGSSHKVVTSADVHVGHILEKATSGGRASRSLRRSVSQLFITISVTFVHLFK